MKDLLKAQYLYDLLYVSSGALANAWLSSEFLWWGKQMLFIDNYLVEQNNVLYLFLYLSAAFVLGVFLRELGQYIYMFLCHLSTFLHKKFAPIKLVEYDSKNFKVIPDDDYFMFRELTRLNAHLVFAGFFMLALVLSIFFKKNLIYIVSTIILLLNSVRCSNEILKDLIHTKWYKDSSVDKISDALES